MANKKETTTVEIPTDALQRVIYKHLADQITANIESITEPILYDLIKNVALECVEDTDIKGRIKKEIKELMEECIEEYVSDYMNDDAEDLLKPLITKMLKERLGLIKPKG